MNIQNQIPSEETFDTRPQVAKILKCTVQHLENLAARGDGPPMVKFGRSVRYPRSGFMRWVAENTVSSTTEGRSLPRRRKPAKRCVAAVQPAGE
jgi:predicted DNA-binding transcriptional regulator AlpA